MQHSVLRIGGRRRAVEDIVRAEVAKERAASRALQREEPRTRVVDRERLIAVLLGRIHVGPGRAVDHHIGTHLLHDAGDRLRRCEIALSMHGSDHLVRGFLEMCGELAAQLTAGAGDQNTHFGAAYDPTGSAGL